MTRQEIDKIREDIKDKARGFCNNQVKIQIRTIPSIKLPRGGKYEGYVFDVTENQIVINDTFKGERFYIFISEILSPADLWEDK